MFRTEEQCGNWGVGMFPFLIGIFIVYMYNKEVFFSRRTHMARWQRPYSEIGGEEV
jgi:hypothetical protein